MKIMYPDDVKLSDENLQSDENDENRRRFDRIPLAVLSILRQINRL